MTNSDQKRRPELDDWDLDELFYEKEKEIEAAENRHALASAQYEARHKTSSDSHEVKKNVRRQSPLDNPSPIPEAEDFKTQRPSSGARPQEIKLTSVEPEPAFDAYDSTYDYDYEENDTGYVPEKSVSASMTEPAPQSPRMPERTPVEQAMPDFTVKPVPDYAPQAQPQMQHQTPPQQPAQPMQAPSQPMAQPAAAAPIPEPGRPVDVSSLMDEEEPEEEEDPAAKKRKMILYGSLIGVIVVLLLLIVILLLTGNDDKKPVQESSASSVTTESSIRPTEIQQMTGVITNIDTETNTFLVYNADKHTEKSFTLDKKNYPKVSLDNLRKGDVVDIRYDMLLNNAPVSVQTSSKAERLEKIKGVTFSEKQVSINRSVFTIDDQLICQFQGKDFDVKQITAQTEFDAVVIGNHLYSITITSATGSLKLENLKDYYGSHVLITPSDGEEQDLIINDTVMTLELPEGSVDVKVVKDDETLYSGKSFITAGKEASVRLPNIEAKKGKVVFSVDIDDEDITPTVTVAGRTYDIDSEIDFEYGDYKVKVTAEGYKDAEVDFKVSQPYQQVTITMEKNLVKVYLSCTPPGVTLYMDGIYQAIMDENGLELDLEYGTYDFTAYMEGYQPMYRSITLDENSSTVYIAFYMEKLPEEESSSSAVIEESSKPAESSQPAAESSTTQESSTPESSAAESSAAESSAAQESESSAESQESSTESAPENSEETSAQQ